MYETVDWEQVAHDDLERTAYHEAGHALFATKHDMALDAVYVRPSGTSASIRESAWTNLLCISGTV